MPTPRIEIDLNKLAHNAREVMAACSPKGISVTAVTKGVCGSPIIAGALLKAGITSFGDSRIANIKKMREAGIDAQFYLIRTPMASEAEQVIKYVDISFNTEISVIRLLSAQALEYGKIHGVILMIDMGDLREGILPAHIKPMLAEIKGLAGVKLIGLGTNLACFAGVVPTEEKMREFSNFVEDLQQHHDEQFEIISGGNSANHQWISSAQDVGLVNHLRIGETILLGVDPLNREKIPGLYTDAFTLIAEVIELKAKPSVPQGKVGQNAFGNVPQFEDNGNVQRGILAVGKQDIDDTAITPRIKAQVLGASSDHLILDVSGLGLEAGSTVEMDVGYSALLRAMTSPYIEKVYLP